MELVTSSIYPLTTPVNRKDCQFLWHKHSSTFISATYRVLCPIYHPSKKESVLKWNSNWIKEQIIPSMHPLTTTVNRKYRRCSWHKHSSRCYQKYLQFANNPLRFMECMELRLWHGISYDIEIKWAYQRFQKIVFFFILLWQKKQAFGIRYFWHRVSK